MKKLGHRVNSFIYDVIETFNRLSLEQKML